MTKQDEIIKKCGEPAEFCFDYINGASLASDIRRMRKWVKCSYDVATKFNKKVNSKLT